LPYPTPLFDGDGNLVGAVNMFIDVTEGKQTQALRQQAVRCRQLAHSTSDGRIKETLNLMAAEYEQKARMIEDAN
jgi:hypothetical protein